jgi:hypothetical protein
MTASQLGNNNALGFKHSEEARTSIGAAKLEVPLSEKHKLAISLVQSNCKKKIEVTDLESNTTTYHESIHVAARALNISNHKQLVSIYKQPTKPYEIYVFNKI